jgi:hypothetical protein
VLAPALAPAKSGVSHKPASVTSLHQSQAKLSLKRDDMVTHTSTHTHISRQAANRRKHQVPLQALRRNHYTAIITPCGVMIAKAPGASASPTPRTSHAVQSDPGPPSSQLPSCAHWQPSVQKGISWPAPTRLPQSSQSVPGLQSSHLQPQSLHMALLIVRRLCVFSGASMRLQACVAHPGTTLSRRRGTHAYATHVLHTFPCTHAY